MTLLDFFSGIGSAHLGAKRAGVQTVGFVEIDKPAVRSYKAMHLLSQDELLELAIIDKIGDRQKYAYNCKPNIYFADDICKIKGKKLPKAEIWCGGFPCQDLSVAGNRRGMEDGERSALFYEFTRLLGEVSEEDKPQYLILENVTGLFSSQRGSDFARLLIELDKRGYDCEWQTFNGEDYHPQHRERVFIVGLLRARSRREILPIRRESRATTSKGIIKVNYAGDYHAVYDPSGDSPTLMARDHKDAVRVLQVGNKNGWGGNQPSTQDRVYDSQGISPTLNACGGGNLEVKITVVAEMSGGVWDKAIERRKKVYSPYGLSPTCEAAAGMGGNTEIKVLTASGVQLGRSEEFTHALIENTSRTLDTNECGKQGVVIRAVLTPDREEKRQNGRRVKNDNEVSYTLTAQDLHGVTDGVRVRKLTPKEYFRLQGVCGTPNPLDGSFDDTLFHRAELVQNGNSQLYKQAGDSLMQDIVYDIITKIQNKGNKLW